MFNKEEYGNQHIARLVGVVTDGQEDQVTPNEEIRRIIQSAIQAENPFIKDGDPLVALGNNGLDGSWFPTGSFTTQEEAFLHVRQKQKEESRYFDGDETSTTFHVFTRKGVCIPLPAR